MLFPAEGASGAGAAGGAAGGDAGGGKADAGKGGGDGGQQARDWSKEGPELETRFAARDQLAKTYEAFGTPEQIQNAVAWANEGIRLRKAIESGEYVPKTAAEKREAAEHGITNTDPYANWDDLTEAQRDDIRYQRFLEKARKELAEPLTQQVNARTQQTANESQLMFKLMRHLAKNPDLPVEEILAEAVQEAAQPGSRLVDMVIDRKLAPRIREQELKDAADKAVEAYKAAEKQRQENERVAQFNRNVTPLIRRDPKTRGKAMTEIQSAFMRKADELARQAS